VQDAATQKPNDHNQVFLVAGERAFADADSVVKHVEHAQSHIATLETESETSRSKIAEQAAEILRLQKIEEVMNGQPATGNQDQTDLMSNDQLAAHAAKLAVGLITQNQEQSTQNSNLTKSEAAVEAAYGTETYRAEVGKIAASLGMTLEAVDALGKTSPDAFNRLFLPAGKPDSGHQPSTGSTYQSTQQQTSSQQEPVNIVKMREPERLALVSQKMKAAGVDGY